MWCCKYQIPQNQRKFEKTKTKQNPEAKQSDAAFFNILQWYFFNVLKFTTEVWWEKKDLSSDTKISEGLKILQNQTRLL